MLIKAKSLTGYKLDSLDGEVGKVREFYFDDKYWTIRYLVADTAGWLKGRQVLISPYALGKIEVEDKDIIVDLNKKQIEESPSLETDKPVSRQFEDSYYGYYGWPVYWNGPYAWGSYRNIERDGEVMLRNSMEEKAWDPHLRSTYAVNGYHIEALDGEIGHVYDFVIDDETWTIRYLIIATSNWWPGKKVLVSPEWIDRVSWSESKVVVALSRDVIKNSPEYSEQALLNRDYETRLFGHYSRSGYWMDEPNALVS